MSANSKLLAIAAIFLGLIKFALMPVLEWQNDLIEQTAQLERRNNKSQDLLLKQPNMEANLEQVKQTYQQLVATYPRFSDTPSFRLETQIRFESLLKAGNLRQKKFFWRSNEDEQVFGTLHKAKFNVNFIGQGKDFALFHARLAAEHRQFKVLNMSAALRTQKADSFGRVKGSFTVEALYWLGGGA